LVGTILFEADDDMAAEQNLFGILQQSNKAEQFQMLNTADNCQWNQ